MRPILPWRSRVAFWLGTPTLALVYAYSVMFPDLDYVRGYWTAVLSGSFLYLIFSCGVASVSAAVEGSRVRRARLPEFPTTRSSFALIYNRLWPSMLVGLIVQAVAFILLSRGTWGAPGGVSPLLIAAAAAIILFHTALGYTLGRFLPLPVSVPLALLLSYGWLGFTWSIDYYPLRYLAGLVIANCCSVETVLDPRAPIAAIVFCIGAGLLLLIAAASRPRMQDLASLIRPTAAIAGVVIIAVASLGIAADLGSTPVRARPQSQATCSGSAPTVCLFPETTATNDPEHAIRAIVHNLQVAGITVPPTIRTSNAASTTATLNMIVNPGMTDPELVHSLTTSLLPQTLASYCGSADDYDHRLSTASTISKWLIVQGSKGIVNPQLVPPINAGTADNYNELALLPASEQRQWVAGAIPALTNCKVKTPEVPKA